MAPQPLFRSFNAKARPRRPIPSPQSRSTSSPASGGYSSSPSQPVMSALRPNQREKAASKNGAAANGIVNGLVDPTRTGKYPVLLSDTLLGRTQKDVFTSVRYNHKPQLSTDAAPSLSRLKPSTPGDKADFELSYQDDGATYSYAGSRSTEAGQYVLYFDAERKAFILDKVDSTFNMNLTRTPENTDPSSLRDQFPHIEHDSRRTAASEPYQATTSPPARDDKPAAKPMPKPAPKTASKPASTKATHQSIGKAASTKKKPLDKKKTVELALPRNDPAPAPKLPTTTTTSSSSSQKKEKPRAPAADDDEEDEDDDDFGLTIEYPDDPGSNARSGGGGDFSPAFPAKKITMRRFSEFLRDSEADDADGESDPEEDDNGGGAGGAFQLPSPVGGPQHHEYGEDDDGEDEQLYRDAGAAHNDRMDVDTPEDADQDEMDLEADLEAALEAANSGDAGEESEVSEED